MMNAQTLDTVTAILQPLFLSVLAYVAAQVGAWIRARVTNTRFQVALLRLNEVIATTVRDLEQTMVEALKEASKDGKLTDDEKATIKQKALNAVLDHVGDLQKLAADLGVTKDAIVSFVSSKIESEVHRLRSGGIVL